MEDLQTEIFQQSGKKLMDGLKKISHFIKPSKARSFILRFRGLRKTLEHQNKHNPLFFPNCETFRADAVRQILDQHGCEGLRIHLGVNDKQEICMVLAGVDCNAKDIVKTKMGQHLSSSAAIAFAVAAPAAEIENDAVLLEDGQRCPKNCPPPSEITN